MALAAALLESEKPAPAMYTLVIAHLSLFTANALLGVGAVVAKLGLSGSNPTLFSVLRELTAAPLLLLMSRIMEGPSTMGALPYEGTSAHMDVSQFMISGFLLFSTNIWYAVGVQVAGTTTAALWQSSIPIWTMLIAACAGLERLSILKLVSIFATFGGCAYIALSDDQGTGASGGKEMLGNVLLLVQVLAMSGFWVSEKQLLRRFTPLATLAYSYAIASVMMLLAVCIINEHSPLLAIVCPDCHGNGWGLSFKALLAVAYWVVFGSIVSYLLLTWSNLHVDASMVGMYFTVQPIAAVLCSEVLLAVAPALAVGLQGVGPSDFGAIGIFLGVVAMAWGSRPAGPAEEHKSDFFDEEIQSKRCPLRLGVPVPSMAKDAAGAVKAISEITAVASGARITPMSNATSETLTCFAHSLADSDAIEPVSSSLLGNFIGQ